jgi:hypothetical protein
MTFLLANWRWILAGAAALGLVAFGLYVHRLRSENLELTDKLARMEAHVASLSRSLVVNQAALSARTKEADALAREKNQALAELRKLYETDPEACSWANARVPDSVLSQLCQ